MRLLDQSVASWVASCSSDMKRDFNALVVKNSFTSWLELAVSAACALLLVDP